MTTSISSISSQITSNIFSKIDTKSKGYVEKSDLASALSDMSESDSDSLINALDSDSDGKITKSEMTTAVESLLSQLNSDSIKSQADKSNGPPPPPNGKMPPPPPPGGDEGFTKDQLSEISSSTDDSKLAELTSSIAANFEAADTNSDGKVSAEEAMTYQESNQESQQTQSASNSSDPLKNTLMKIAQLVEAYGFNSDSSDSTVSVSA